MFPLPAGSALEREFNLAEAFEESPSVQLDRLIAQVELTNRQDPRRHWIQHQRSMASSSAASSSSSATTLSAVPGAPGAQAWAATDFETFKLNKLVSKSASSEQDGTIDDSIPSALREAFRRAVGTGTTEGAERYNTGAGKLVGCARCDDTGKTCVIKRSQAKCETCRKDKQGCSRIQSYHEYRARAAMDSDAAFAAVGGSSAFDRFVSDFYGQKNASAHSRPKGKTSTLVLETQVDDAEGSAAGLSNPPRSPRSVASAAPKAPSKRKSRSASSHAQGVQSDGEIGQDNDAEDLPAPSDEGEAPVKRPRRRSPEEVSLLLDNEGGRTKRASRHGRADATKALAEAAKVRVELADLRKQYNLLAAKFLTAQDEVGRARASEKDALRSRDSLRKELGLLTDNTGRIAEEEGATMAHPEGRMTELEAPPLSAPSTGLSDPGGATVREEHRECERQRQDLEARLMGALKEVEDRTRELTISQERCRAALRDQDVLPHNRDALLQAQAASSAGPWIPNPEGCEQTGAQDLDGGRLQPAREDALREAERRAYGGLLGVLSLELCNVRLGEDAALNALEQADIEKAAAELRRANRALAASQDRLHREVESRVSFGLLTQDFTATIGAQMNQ
ncbi:hypothetical protein PLICRDRAFT_180865 [Plicaturopsis crispa FD-325 SS-3]|uniref:Uncharacterized protein n=1 Tax=Plicaturopsis crispa FD-325 SS-3 TaxID=944288 RepID=A0A0C9T192_PLICR|nr:hypothetical protein PLICRDRAFT_180865 [Plicaturopsis crispa FD-325 SS-3]